MTNGYSVLAEHTQCANATSDSDAIPCNNVIASDSDAIPNMERIKKYFY